MAVERAVANRVAAERQACLAGATATTATKQSMAAVIAAAAVERAVGWPQ